MMCVSVCKKQLTVWSFTLNGIDTSSCGHTKYISFVRTAESIWDL